MIAVERHTQCDGEIRKGKTERMEGNMTNIHLLGTGKSILP